MLFQRPIDILILSNGPGELATWVRPVVKALRSQLGNDREQVRISVVLAPCVHANGKEAAIAQSYPEVDRVQAPDAFFSFLVWGRTKANWDWRDRGVVLFLGGDQFFTVVIGKRLGYQTVTYAEWEARWLRWIDRFGMMHPQSCNQVPQRYTHKLTVVGDLMAEAGDFNPEQQREIAQALALQPGTELIGLLPGSKPAKLRLGVPLCLAIAERIAAVRPETRFVIPVAPMLDLPSLAKYADPEQNPTMSLVEGVSAELISPPQARPYLQTEQGLRIDLWTESPAYPLLCQSRLCLTTIGANTAELAALAVPMLVLLPTQQLDAMRAWDGVPGLLVNLPGLGAGLARVINWLVLQRGLGLRAWPNIWAGKEIVPELLGRLQPQKVAEQALDLLNHPEKLEKMRCDLRQVRGEPGAAANLANLLKETLEHSGCGHK